MGEYEGTDLGIICLRFFFFQKALCSVEQVSALLLQLMMQKVKEKLI